MTILTTSELKTLTLKNHQGPFVSIYMPTHRAGPETRGDSIRLKNLITQAEEQLIESGIRAPEARKLLEPGKQLVEDYDFWQHQGDGLAVFMAANLVKTYRVPLEFEELLVVGSRFHLKPLMPLLSEDGQFYVLALSQNEVKLFRGTRFSIDEVDLEDIPKSLADALKYDLPQKQHQYHTATATPGSPAGGRPAVFHGHGIGADEEKNNLLRYFQQINKGLHSFLVEDNPAKPLVLAGVEYLFPIYKEANTYPNLMDNGVKGNVEVLQPGALQRQAWQIVRPFFQQAQKDAMGRYKELANTERASKDIRQILPAAHYGQVDTLFVAVNQQQWGNFNPNTNTLELRPEPKNGDEDLLDTAAVQTLLKGGTIFAVAPEKIPDDAPMAAIFRY